MSLWTPDGEHQVPRDAGPGGQRPPTSTGPDPEYPQQPGAEQPLAPEEPLTPEQEEQARAMARELAEARERLLETDVATVLSNHALGVYELAAIHLTSDEPKLDEAKLAVDGLAALVEGLEGRLGEAEPTLRDALHQARMAFVQRSSEQGPPPNDEQN